MKSPEAFSALSACNESPSKEAYEVIRNSYPEGNIVLPVPNSPNHDLYNYTAAALLFICSDFRRRVLTPEQWRDFQAIIMAALESYKRQTHGESVTRSTISQIVSEFANH